MEDQAPVFDIDWSKIESLPYVEEAPSPMVYMDYVEEPAEEQEPQQELRPLDSRASTYYDPLRDVYTVLPAPETRAPEVGSTQVEDIPVTKKGTRWTEEELKVLRESRKAGLSAARISEMLPGRTPRAVQVKWGHEVKKNGDLAPVAPTPRVLGDRFTGPNPRYKSKWTPEQDEKLLRAWWEKGSFEDLRADPEMPSRDVACLKSRVRHLAGIRNELYIRVMKDYANVVKNSPALIPLTK